MRIREYRPDDLDAVLALWLAGNLDAHPFIPRAYWEGNLPLVREQIPQAETLTAEHGGEIAGFLGLTGNYVAGVFVSRALRSQGVGRALLDEAKRRRPCLELHVYRKNRRALAFYRREGFEEQGAQTDEATGEEELCLTWRRSSPANAENL